ncbi:MAG: hypothetical protein ABR579_11770 [Actinomycetota bacterium]
MPSVNGPSILILYLPAMLFAFVSNHYFQRFFDVYKQRHGPDAITDLYPLTREEWDLRYGNRPWRWLMDAPVLILRTYQFANRPHYDEELDRIRRLGGRWAVAAIISALAGVIAMLVLVAPR